MMDQPTAEHALRALEPLVGTWSIEATGADGKRWPGEGRMSVEWHESGQHLVQRTTVDLPEAPDTVSVIGCDAANGSYVQVYTDDRGVCRIYQMTFGDGHWTLQREGEPFAQRFTATFSDDGRTITGRWQLAEAGQPYETDFDLVHRRIDGRGARWRTADESRPAAHQRRQRDQARPGGLPGPDGRPAGAGARRPSAQRDT